jgi:hypothetical protein
MAEDRYGSGQETGPDYPGHNPTVGSKKENSSGGYDCMKGPGGYVRSGYKRSGTHHSEEK